MIMMMSPRTGIVLSNLLKVVARFISAGKLKEPWTRGEAGRYRLHAVWALDAAR